MLEELLHIIRSYATEHYGSSTVRDQFGASTDLAEWGLDSVDLVCIAARIEDHFDISVDPTLLLQCRTLAEAFVSLGGSITTSRGLRIIVPATEE